MDKCTHEVRAEYWKGIIKASGQRPAGASQQRAGWTKQAYVSRAIIIGSANSDNRHMA